MSINEHNMKNSLDENVLKLADGCQVSEEQVGRYMSGLLNERAQYVHADVAQRLSFARNSVVAQHASQQTQAHSIHQSGNVLQWLGDHAGQYFGRHRVMSVAMVAGVMLLTFFTVQQFEFNRNLESSDAFLLASELPPEAYADKGFDTWLVSKRD